MTNQITDEQFEAAIRMMEGERRELPLGQPERMQRRVTCIMTATGRDRGWARARAAEIWPDEWAEFLAAVAV